MPRPSREQWDGLAEVWHVFEADGLRPRHVLAAGCQLASPCAVIGSGLGLICQALRDAGVASVIGVDFSPAMVERSRALRGIEARVGAVDALPLRDAELGSAVVTTGVLDPSDHDGLARAWTELGRVVQSGGSALVAFFEPAPEFREFVAGTGILEDDVHRTDRIVQMWRRREGAQPPRVRPFLDSWFEALDAAVETLREREHPDPVGHLRRCLDWGQPALTAEADPLRAADPVFAVCGRHRFERDSVTVFHLQRR